MEERIGLKRPRPIVGDDEVENPPQQRKPRFPKGKKLKVEGRLDVADGFDGDSNVQIGPNFAAKERAKRRIERKETDLFGRTADFTDFEVQYEDDSNFEADGVEIEPFNLQQEREEGYFDDNGNYVEYRREQEIKDAWLDSISADLRIAEKIPARQIPEGEYEDLSLEEIRTLKRRITDILQPGETIIHALKRLKGSSSDKRAKMSESTKLMFDQLTEAAMKLMENGEYNVYHQERETFEREIASKEADKFDMFGDDDDNDGNENLQSDEATLGFTSGQTTHSATERQEESENFASTQAVTGGSESDYVYDPSSGYYYSGTLGYYYDPMSKLYCCAASGIWYSFDEQLGTYIEVNIASSQETQGI
ncbi:CD2 antigen cytoplasmic tail-binding protein 2 homolog isoform X1 [Dendrobium catenatum]|uniref:CD2 antigen cytoplasmic tail-binding protein 2 homolog isoform X1 n=1 Tax=Dendrobium catenatum TaxID=906689 RepID=UPI0009F60647|nr:CD2 antigen cytoplasmic tail-binding protein 2 homolog isoform X1 [Dendrobium catenatum]